jgi:hypothetical protein
MSSSSFARLRVVMAFALWLMPAIVSAESVTLGWDPSDGATGYKVSWGTTSGAYPNAADAGSSTTFVISGLTAGGTYWAVVQAYNSAGISPYSTPLQFTVPGVSCTSSITPTAFSAPSAGTSGSITVSTPAGCAWSASSASADLVFQNGTGRSGAGSVTFTVAANQTSTARTLTATVAGQAFTVSQAAAAACTYSISPVMASSLHTGSSGSVTVTTQAGCGWSATNPTEGLSFQNGTGRTGSGSVAFTVAANTTATARTLSATIAGKAFTVSQGAAPCTYEINPPSINVFDGAASGTITVTTLAGCAWTSTSANTALTFQNGTGRSGPGSVTFAITANTGTTARTATGFVAGKTFTVTQAAPPQACSYAITPGSVNAPTAGMTGVITVTTGAACTWNASSIHNFVTFPDGSGRTGSGTVTYVVAANPTAFRTATATVAGRPFTVSQAGSTCTYSISPANASRAAAAGTGTVTVITQTGCEWTATTSSTFLTFVDGSGRSGTGAVAYAVSENTDPDERNAAGTIAGMTFTVAQAGAGSSLPSPLKWSSDFNGDAKNDILVQDTASGAVEAWFLEGPAVKGTQALSDSLDANWRLAGRGDFNADSKPDLVWQHADGRVVIWYMDGTTRLDSETPSGGQAPDPQWTIAGVGDFNADHHPDLVWHHQTTGALSVWLMNGATVFADASILPDRMTDLRWKVVGVADFNIDGKPDLLWRNTGTGDVAAWLMNGLSRIIHAPLSPMALTDQGWQVGGVADVNGDNRTDIVWHHTDGSIMIWHMSLTSRVSAPVLALPLPAGWIVAGPK